MEQAMKNFFLFLSKNKMMTRFAKKYGLRYGASRFVAGESIDEATDKVRQLNQNGLAVTMDFLGEFIDNEAESAERTEQLLKMVKRIRMEKLNSQLSLKLTSVGLDFSEMLTMENMRRILDTAKENGVFVTIDMEDSSRCQRTLNHFKALRKEYDNVGTVLQAYLFRVLGDAEDLNAYDPNLRLVKGAYKESTDVAFPNKKDVDENYKKLIEKQLLSGNFTAIATHDEAIIRFTKEFAEKHQIDRDKFEFQMLYGIRPERQQELANEGFAMRVYVPYGNDWFGYFMRRLAERPENVGFVLKSMFKK